MSNWYVRARQAFPQISDSDWPVFSQLLAATSIQCRPSVNAKRALAIWNGQQIGLMPAARSEVRRVICGLPLNGPKTSVYARALAGDTSAIPIDRWMLRWAGEKYVNRRSTIRIKRMVRHRARKWNISPRDAQARIWEEVIVANGRTPESY